MKMFSFFPKKHEQFSLDLYDKWEKNSWNSYQKYINKIFDFIFQIFE